MLKTCSRPGAEKSGESVEEISTPGNLSRISRNPGKSETYRITDRPLKKAEAMGRGYGRARRSPSKLSARPPRSLLRSPTLLLLSLRFSAPHALHCFVAHYITFYSVTRWYALYCIALYYSGPHCFLQLTEWNCRKECGVQACY